MKVHKIVKIQRAKYIPIMSKESDKSLGALMLVRQ